MLTPVRRRPSSSPAVKRAAIAPSILVVDDEADLCQNLADILGDFNYRVDTALNGTEALALVRQKRFDVALLDLQMPGMDGLTLYREIRRLQPDMVALIVTAYASGRTADDALLAGAWQVLSKPLDLSRLLSLMDDATSQPLVLVVDDDESLCDNLWDLLRGRNLRVCVAHSEQQALSRLRDCAYQVVLVDLKLPGGDGRNVLMVIRDRYPEARAVLITAHGTEFANDDSVLLATPDAVCHKPFDIRRLLDTVDRLARA